MRIFVKFYPIVDTIVIDLEASATIGALKNKIYEHTNLTAQDKLKVIVKNVPMTSDDITLWDLSIKEDTTFHVVVVESQESNKKFKVHKPHSLGVFDAFYTAVAPTAAASEEEEETEELKEQQELNTQRIGDEISANILSFLDLSSLVHGASLTCRKWRNVENQSLSVWAPLAAAAIRQHCQEEHVEKINEYMTELMRQRSQGTNAAAAKKKNAPNTCKQLVVSRHVRAKIWDHMRAFSLVPQPTEEQLALKFEKEKAIKVKREPRPLTEEEEQFLAENDANVLRKNLRKDKTAREKLRRHKQIQTKKDDIESGVWKVVPNEFIQFDYDSLQQHTFGLHPLNNEEGITGFYCGKGRFSFIDKEGQLLYLADIEPEEEFYRFKNVIVDESNEKDAKDVITHFFSLFAQCAVRNKQQKQLLDVVVNEQGLKGVSIAQIDAIADTLLVTKKYEADTKVEKPRVEAKRGKELSSPRFGKTIEEPIVYQATTFVYQAKSDEEAAPAQKLSFDNLIELYVALLVSAQKDDDVSLLGLPILEQMYIKKLKLDENDTKNQELVGSLLAQAISKFMKDTGFTVTPDYGVGSAEDVEEFDAEETASKKKRKKPLKKAVIVVSSEAEKELVQQGLSKQFDLNTNN